MKADYVLRQDVYSQDIYDVYENVPEAIWSNDLFIIVDRADEVKPLGIVMGDGFYAAERREGGTMRWTSSQKSEIVFCNNSGEDAALDFSFMALPAGEYKTILVKLEDGTVLANGDTEHQNMLSGYIAEVKAGES